MESVINEIEFDFEQTVSIRTDVKLSKDDVKQIVSEAPAETLEEIVYQSLVTDELYLRARAKEIAAKLKQDDLDVNRICLLYTSPSPRDVEESRMPSSA